MHVLLPPQACLLHLTVQPTPPIVSARPAQGSLSGPPGEQCVTGMDVGGSTHGQPHPACSDGGGRAGSLHSARNERCRYCLGTLALTWPGRPSVHPPRAYEPRWNERDHHALPADRAGPNTWSRGGGWASLRKEQQLGGRPHTPGLPAQAVSPDSGVQLPLSASLGRRAVPRLPTQLPPCTSCWVAPWFWQLASQVLHPERARARSPGRLGAASVCTQGGAPPASAGRTCQGLGSET